MHEPCPLSGIRRLSAIREHKHIATGIAVGTLTVVRYTVDVRYSEYPLSEVSL